MRVLLATTVAVLAAAPAAAHATVVPPAVIDTAPTAITDIAVAPDGSGGLVYTKADGIHAAVLATDGTWAPPVRVDPDAGAEDQPRVAAGNGGRLLIGYRDDGGATLKWRLIPQAGAPMTAEAVVTDAGGADRIRGDWDLDMSAAGVAYAAWNQQGDARVWRLEGTAGQLGGDALQQVGATVSDGSNGPDIRIAVDDAGGAALLFSQEDDSVLLRRLTGLTPGPPVDVRVPSVLGEAISGAHHQLDLDIAGDGVAWTAGSAMYPNGGHAVGVPVQGTSAGAAAVFDLHPAAETDNAERPDVALGGTPLGLYVAEPNQRAGVWGGLLKGNATATAPVRLDSSPHEPAASEIPVAAMGDLEGLVAWTRDVANGAAGPFEVRARTARQDFAPEELLLSAPALGDARIPFGVTLADGAGASRFGDAAVLMEQDDGATKRVVVGRYDAPPTTPSVWRGPWFSDSPRPTFTWYESTAVWSPLQGYRIYVDGRLAGTAPAGALQYTMQEDLALGMHSVRITAFDALGQESGYLEREIEVAAPYRDRIAPRIKIKVRGKLRKGRKVAFRVTTTDEGGSGVASVTFRSPFRKPVTRAKSAFTVTRRFGRAGRYVVKVSARDGAGNRRTRDQRITIRR